MTLITFQDGKIVLRDGKVGTEQDCCCEEYECTYDCNKTVTVNWSNNGASGTFTYTVAERGKFVQLPGLRVSSSVFCQTTPFRPDYPNWSISVVFCAAFPYTSGSIAASGIRAVSNGCPPDGAVAWTNSFLLAGVDASASIS